MAVAFGPTLALRRGLFYSKEPRNQGNIPEFLNSLDNKEALDILFEENDIVRVKEYYFSVTFHGRQIRHKHYVDFLVGNDVLIECKAIEQIGPEQRQ